MSGSLFPLRIVVDQNGNYWRENAEGYSMCPTSDDNEPIEVRAVYVLTEWLKPGEHRGTTVPSDESLREYEAWLRDAEAAHATGPDGEKLVG